MRKESKVGRANNVLKENSVCGKNECVRGKEIATA